MNDTQMSSKKTWEVVILILSLLVLLEITLEVVWDFSPTVQRLIVYTDTLICGCFMYDIYLRAVVAEDKRSFWLSWLTWVDILASIPFGLILHTASLTNAVKMLKAFRVFKLIRGIKAIKPILDWVSAGKPKSILVMYTTSLFILIFYSSLAIYTYESDMNENINCFGDALWFSFITVSSVGYGDIYPSTGIGRVIAVVLVVAGMGLLSLVTAEFASKFMKNANLNNLKDE